MNIETFFLFIFTNLFKFNKFKTKMNLDENAQNLNNKEEEITVKIRAMDKEFEIKIKKSLTIKALKEKISEVNNNFII